MRRSSLSRSSLSSCRQRCGLLCILLAATVGGRGGGTRRHRGVAGFTPAPPPLRVAEQPISHRFATGRRQGNRGGGGGRRGGHNRRRAESYMDELQRARNVEELQNVLANMHRKGAAPEVHHYNAAISRATSLRGGRAGLAFFEDLLAQSHGDDFGGDFGGGGGGWLAPDAFSVSAAIKAAAEVDWRRSVDILRSAPSHGVEPDVYCYTAAITACRRAVLPASAARQAGGSSRRQQQEENWSSACRVALGLYQEMVTGRDRRNARGGGSGGVVAPNEYTYSALIGACENAGRGDAAVALIDAMLRTPSSSSSSSPPPPSVLEPAPYVWTSAIVACDRGGNVEAALGLLRTMCSRPRIAQILRASGEADPPRSRSGQEPGLEAALDASVGRDRRGGDGNRDSVEAVVTAFNAAITACGRAGKWQAALKLLDGMRHSRAGRRTLQGNSNGAASDSSSGGGGGGGGATADWPAPDLVSFNAALGALAHSFRHDEASQLFEDLRHIATATATDDYSNSNGNAFTPTETTCGVVLSTLCRGQRWGDALALLDEMEAKAADPRGGAAQTMAAPTKATYNLLIRECEQAGEDEIALDLQARFAESGLQVSPPPPSQQQQQQQQAGSEQGRATGDWFCDCGWVNRHRNKVCGGALPRGVPESARTHGCGAPRPTAAVPAQLATGGPMAPLGREKAQGTQAAPHVLNLEDYLDDDEDDSSDEASADKDADVISNSETDTEAKIDSESDQQLDSASISGDSGSGAAEQTWSWEVGEGEAVEVWHEGGLVLGNVILEDSSSGNGNGNGSPKIRVLVFDPSTDLTGTARDDDRDDFDEYFALPSDGGGKGGKGKKKKNAPSGEKQEEAAARAEAARRTITVAADQLVGSWGLQKARPAARPAAAAFYPSSAAEWSRTVRDGAVLRSRMPAERDSDGLWKAAKAAVVPTKKKKKNKKTVTSKAAEKGAGALESVTTAAAARFLLYGDVAMGAEAEDESLHERVVAAAHMAASDMLSAGASTRFKRTVSSVVVVVEEEDMEGAVTKKEEEEKEEEGSGKGGAASPAKAEEEQAGEAGGAAAGGGGSALESLLAAGANPKDVAAMQALLGGMPKAPKEQTTTSPTKKRASSSSSSSSTSSSGVLRMNGGGWRPIAQSVVLSREVLSFTAAVEAGRRALAEGRDASEGSSRGKREEHRRIAEQLELVAMGGGAGMLGSEGRQALKALGITGKSAARGGAGAAKEPPAVTAEAAAEVLLAAGHWSAKRATGAAKSAKWREERYDASSSSTSSSSSSSSLAVQYWPEEVVDAAAAKARIVGARRRRLASMPLPPSTPLFRSGGGGGDDDDDDDASTGGGSSSFRPVDPSCVIPGSSDDESFSAAAAALAAAAIDARAGGKTRKGGAQQQKSAAAAAAATLAAWPCAEWQVGPHGRVDLRALTALCIDRTRTGLKDDALCWDPATHTLLVHSTTHLAHALYDSGGGAIGESPAPKAKAKAKATAAESGSESGASESESESESESDSESDSGGEVVDLDALAARRGEACYLPGGALLLLPAPLLNAASLASGFEAAAVQQPAPLSSSSSSQAPDGQQEQEQGGEAVAASAGVGAGGLATANECLTVAFRFDPSDGSLVGSWLFESVIGPVTAVTFDVADANVVLPTTRRSAQPSSSSSSSSSSSLSSSMLDPATAAALVELHEALPWLERARQRYDSHTKGGAAQAPQQQRKHLGAKTTKKKKKKQGSSTEEEDYDEEEEGDYSSSSFSSSSSSSSSAVSPFFSSERLVDVALSLFSEEAYAITRRRKVTPPRVGRAARYGTAPLRRYVDLLAQRQLLSLVRPPHVPLSAERVRSAMALALARRGVAVAASNDKKKE